MDSMDNLLPSDSASQVGNTSQASGVSASSSVSQKLQEEKRNLLTLQQKKGMLEQRRKLERDKLELRLREEEMDLEEKLTLSDAKVNSYQDELVNRTYVTLNSNSSRNLEPNLALAISNPFSDISSITPKNPFLQDTNPFRQNITYSTTPPAIDFTNLPPVDNTFNATEQLLYQLKMPAVEIKKFGGDPIEYRLFLRQFRTKILKYTLNPDEKMNYLEQYTFDQPNRIVRGYSYLDAHNGFESVMREFESKYGDPEILATSYVNKALGWPLIKEDDGKALEDFGIFLAECEFAVLEIDSLKVLDYSENLKKLVLKLPRGLFERWRGINQNLKDFGKQPSFQDLVKFVKREGRKAVDPTYGKSALSSSSSIKQKDQHSDKPKRSSHQTFVTTGTVDNRINCEHCKNVHNIANCDKLKQLSHDDKINVLKKLDLCFACFKPGHLSTGCTARLICGLCKKHHPTILHNDNWIPKHSSHKSSSNLVTNATALPDVTRAGMCTMPVIPVCVQGRNNSKTIFTYALMDPGSSACFCTEQVVKQLGICAPKASVSLQTIHGTQVQSTYMVKDLKVYAPDLSDSVNIPLCYTTVSIPVSKMSIPTNQDIKHWSHLTGIIPNTYNCEIGMIIGNNIPEAYSPYEFRIGPRGSPHASRTPLGWVVWNLVRPGIANDQHVAINRIEAELLSEVEHLKSLEVLVKKGFNHDFPESAMFDKDELSRQDKQFLEKAKNSTVIKDNHYEIGLPIKNECVILPDNSSVAVNRLGNLKKKFTKDPPFQKEYATLVESLILKGYAEEVKDGVVNNTQKWIIPHHAVLHKKKKKYRVVFDCSSKYQGVSLNDHLLQGPDLTNTLVGVLLHFRLGRIAFTADIEAMFHQVKVPERDRDLLRFLWWPGGDMDIKPKLYRMTSHLFGAVSSPSIASYALRRTALDNVELYSEDVTSVILQDFYVDDCLHSMDNVNEAVVLVEKLVELCSLGGFHLHKWISNSPDVISNIPESECAIENPLLGEDDTIERALGVQWNVTSDTLIYKISVQDQPATRRGLLSVISSIFDPLGLASPALLPAKCILQKLCASGCSWDEVVEEPLLGQWVKWLNDLPNLEGFKMPRCVKSKHQYEIATTEIHHFSDASETGFGVASYIRYTDVTGNISCSLILGKSRVCPLKKVTIPRLELTAAYVAAKLNRKILDELKIHIDRVCFWTDSSTVLGYIGNECSRFKTFVSNRVSYIRETTDLSQWRHISGSENPADLASRGTTIRGLLDNKLWLEGPEFLSKPECDWPKSLFNFPICDSDPNVKQSVGVVTQPNHPLDILISYYSDYDKLIRAVALLKLVARSYKQKTKLDLTLSVSDILNAEHFVIRYEQQTHWNIDLSKNTSINIPSLSKLDPIIRNELICVGGRIKLAEISLDSKHQILIPKKSKLSELLIFKTHRNIGHLGKNTILSKLRLKYWILGAAKMIKSVTSKCVTCRKYSAKKLCQKMADLPAERLSSFHSAFYNTGMDYFGPFELRHKRSTVKRYGVIFTCLSSRAVHLEVANSLDTDSCINAIRRFVARRGKPYSIRSDNGSNLVSADKELKASIKQLNQSNINTELTHKGIRWYFNPPSASHFGGAWEKLIRQIRKVLSSLQHDQLNRMDDEGFVTLMCEVEAILNNRPITKASDSPNDLDALTPNHLLGVTSHNEYSLTIPDKTDNYVKKRWRQVQYLSDLFWKRWLKEYLPSLQQRQKWLKPKDNVKIGDIVLLAEGNMRNSWILAKVLEVVLDKHGLVRVVTVQTKTSTLKRPIHKLCSILEAESA